MDSNVLDAKGEISHGFGVTKSKLSTATTQKLFERIVIITSRRYAVYFEKLKNSQVKLSFVNSNGIDVIAEAIKERTKYQPKRTLWLTHMEIFQTAGFKCSELCSSCAEPLEIFIPPNQSSITDYVTEIQNSFSALAKNVSSVLDADSSFAVLPPFPPTFLALEEYNHDQYHKMDLESMFYFVTKESLDGFESFFLNLNKQLISLSFFAFSKANISLQSIMTYAEIVNSWSSYVNAISENIFDYPYVSRVMYNQWVEHINKLLSENLEFDGDEDMVKSVTEFHNSVDTTFDCKLNNGIPVTFDQSQSMNSDNDYDHVVFICSSEEHSHVIPEEEWNDKNISVVNVSNDLSWDESKEKFSSVLSKNFKKILFIITGSFDVLGKISLEEYCLNKKCTNPITYLQLNSDDTNEIVSKANCKYKLFTKNLRDLFKSSVVIRAPLICIDLVRKPHIGTFSHEDVHRSRLNQINLYVLEDEEIKWINACKRFYNSWTSNVHNYIDIHFCVPDIKNLLNSFKTILNFPLNLVRYPSINSAYCQKYKVLLGKMIQLMCPLIKISTLGMSPEMSLTYFRPSDKDKKYPNEIKFGISDSYFFSYLWKNCITFGPKNSVQCLVEAIKGARFQQLPKKKILFLGASESNLASVHCEVLNRLHKAGIKDTTILTLFGATNTISDSTFDSRDLRIVNSATTRLTLENFENFKEDKIYFSNLKILLENDIADAVHGVNGDGHHMLQDGKAIVTVSSDFKYHIGTFKRACWITGTASDMLKALFSIINVITARSCDEKPLQVEFVVPKSTVDLIIGKNKQNLRQIRMKSESYMGLYDEKDFPYPDESCFLVRSFVGEHLKVAFSEILKYIPRVYKSDSCNDVAPEASFPTFSSDENSENKDKYDCFLTTIRDLTEYNYDILYRNDIGVLIIDDVTKLIVSAIDRVNLTTVVRNMHLRKNADVNMVFVAKICQPELLEYLSSIFGIPLVEGHTDWDTADWLKILSSQELKDKSNYIAEDPPNRSQIVSQLTTGNTVGSSYTSERNQVVAYSAANNQIASNYYSTVDNHLASGYTTGSNYMAGYTQLDCRYPVDNQVVNENLFVSSGAVSGNSVVNEIASVIPERSNQTTSIHPALYNQLGSGCADQKRKESQSKKKRKEKTRKEKKVSPKTDTESSYRTDCLNIVIDQRRSGDQQSPSKASTTSYRRKSSSEKTKRKKSPTRKKETRHRSRDRSHSGHRRHLSSSSRHKRGNLRSESSDKNYKKKRKRTKSRSKIRSGSSASFLSNISYSKSSILEHRSARSRTRSIETISSDINYTNQPVLTVVNFSVQGALDLLDCITDKIGILGPILKSLITTVKLDLNNSQIKALNTIKEEDNIIFLKMTVDQLKKILQSSPLSEISLISKTIEWTTRLISYAEMAPQHEVNINLKAIAEASINKPIEFTLSLIKTALAYENNETPTKEKINEIFLKVCSMQCEAMMNSSGMN